jgi:hypothetical protein
MKRDKKTIKREILEKFRSMGEEEFMLSPRWLHGQYLEGLTKEEKRLFRTAINELVSKGLIKQTGSPHSTLQLTEKGANLIG